MPTPTNTTPSSGSSDGYDADSLTYYLSSYYGQLFPASLMYRWLSYGNPEFFSHREFSLTLPGDVYIRFQSFNSCEDLMAELKKRKPIKIDIGAVYNQKPRTRDTFKEFIPLEKEFVLDIDLTDYDEVRTCCQGAKVCPKCWKFIALAVTILDDTLRNDFGFQHLLWVYSGRRGVHCWICDEFALSMDSNTRSAVLEYLTVIRGGDTKAKKVTVSNIDKPHPFITRSIEIIDDHFEEICDKDQNLLYPGDKNFDMLPDEVRKAVLDSSDRFTDVMEYLKKNNDKKNIRTAEKELKLQLCYPRLDFNVSKDLNHLLKSPFCIHPKTGQVCVPFNPEKAFEFQPSEVPTIAKLLEEVGTTFRTQRPADGESSGSPPMDVNPNETSLGPYLKIFEKFVKGLEKKRAENVAVVKKEEGVSLEF